ENIYYGNNTKTRYDYNPLNFRLTRLLTTRNLGKDILQDLNYEYDAAGNITKITDDAQQTHYFNNSVIAPVATFEYDALYRLTKATGRELTALTAPGEDDFANNIPCPNNAGNAMQNYTHYYEYDALGNMLSDNWKDYVYDTDTNRLLKHDALQGLDDYTYDAHGNMLTMPHLSEMLWDYNDRLFAASNGTFTSYYNYDAEGNRTRKVIDNGNIIEACFYINGYELYLKVTNNGVDIERTTVNIADDEKVFVRVETETGQSPVVRYQYDNHLGSACLELDEQGYIISYEEYHPFGTTSYRAGRNATEVSQKRYKYCGKERDEETGLYYFGARYYAAWLCRFCSCDVKSADYPQVNPYCYALNNPLRYVDPTGMSPENPDKLKQAAKVGVEASAKYKSDHKVSSACNVAVREAVKEFTGQNLLSPENVGKGTGKEAVAAGQANAIAQALASGKIEGFKELDIKGDYQQLQDLANQGRLIVGAVDKSATGSGHVVMFVPGEMGVGESWRGGGNMPQVMDGGNKGDLEQTPLTTVSGQTTVKNMKFYIYESSQETTGNGMGDQYNSSISAAPSPTISDRLLESKVPIVQDVGRLIKFVGRLFK
ncbi:MAG: RHS repeat-associated core domain-containing protein, partial [Chitinophagaceae bacterium]|nr:RHS repeat-associated core domain-containing protein [Chitinophagaceae bacterium]